MTLKKDITPAADNGDGRHVRLTDGCYRIEKYELEQPMSARFERMAALRASGVAVKSDAGELTYDQLNRATNRLARAIIARLGEGEEPVGLLLENDIPMLTAIIAVLKCGKAYVPLDPRYPAARLSHMLEDSGASLVVTNNRNLALAEELTGGARSMLNSDEVDAALPDGNLDIAVSPEAPAWILYTSGSTGKPKGVYQTNRSAMHVMMRQINLVGIRPDDRHVLLQSFTFSGSQSSYLATPLAGGLVYIFDVREKGIPALLDALARERITIYSSVPTTFRAFASALPEGENLPDIRIIRLTGELVTARDVQLFKTRFSPTSILLNFYGATESSTSIWHRVDSNTPVSGNVVPIGHPAEDFQAVILDEEGKKVRPGQIGEIVVKSRYLAKGYWRKDDLTRQCFLDDPDGGETRVYHTGDLGRTTGDGCIVALGRRDSLAKIRGYRIEIGDVECALLGAPGVSEAAVVAREDTPEDARLVAYVVPDNATRPTTTSLRQYLSEKLPDYMVPAAFVILDSMPRTATGKLDRRSLPAPGRGRPELETAYVAPVSPVEEELCRIWAEVLNIDKVGTNDNFLELGGHSLVAGRIMSRILDAFRLDMPLATLFASGTVAGLAVAVAQRMAENAPPEDVERILKEIEGAAGHEDHPGAA